MSAIIVTKTFVSLCSRGWGRYLQLLERHPARTHALNTCFLMGAGDVIAQVVLENRKLRTYDFRRTARFAAVGLFVAGPGMHVWYRTLDRVVVGSGLPAAFRKMFADQAFFLPVYLGAFIAIMGALRRETVDEIQQKISRDFSTMLMSSYSLWPGVQIVNFYLVPLRHRILVINIVCLFWNTYIGWKAEKELPLPTEPDLYSL